MIRADAVRGTYIERMRQIGKRDGYPNPAIQCTIESVSASAWARSHQWMGPMIGCSRLAMLVILLASVVTRGESRPLQFVKQIGSGWLSEKPGWMSFVSFSPDGTMVASDGAGSTTVAARQRGSVVRKAALRSQGR